LSIFSIKGFEFDQHGLLLADAASVLAAAMGSHVQTPLAEAALVGPHDL
jgi:hypothetical protein